MAPPCPPPHPRGGTTGSPLRQVGFYDYDVNDNGTIKHFGTSTSDYSTDVLKGKVQEFIGANAAQGKPFFAYVAPYAPHAPATPAPRDLHTFDPEKAPRLPSFNEADVTDKPPWIKSLRRLTSDDIANIDQRHENRVESLQAVDDLVAGVVGKLGEQPGVLSNTYIVFTSDNGSTMASTAYSRARGGPTKNPSACRSLSGGLAWQQARARQACPKHRLPPDLYGPGGGTNAPLRRWAFFASSPHGEHNDLLEDGHPD